MITVIVLASTATASHNYRLFFVVRFKIYSLSSFQLYSTVLLPVITMPPQAWGHQGWRGGHGPGDGEAVREARGRKQSGGQRDRRGDNSGRRARLAPAKGGKDGRYC